jgi:hypothetical protein
LLQHVQVPGCPTAAALDTALQGMNFSTLLTSVSSQNGMTLPYTTVAEAKTFLAEKCVNTTTPSMGDAAMCLGKETATMLECASLPKQNGLHVA